MKTEIIYEDNDILVVYKPAGLATQTAKLGQADVVSEVKNYLMRTQKSPAKNPVYLGIIHRLDQPVEGLLVFAKNKKAAADLTAQLQRQGEGGNLNKHYYAVVCGKPSDKQGELVDYMYKSRENLAVIVEKTVKAGGSDESGAAVSTGEICQMESQARKAVLEYRIVAQQSIVPEALSGNEATKIELGLADIHILTGRFHQIRAQMAHAGMPLLGDAKYGSEEAKKNTKELGVQTVALCAYSLEFSHPTTKKKLHFQEKPRGKSFGLFSKE